MLENAKEVKTWRTYQLVEMVQVTRCTEGERLYQAWVSAIELHVPILIYATMHDYFSHKNGVRNYGGKVTILGCRRCGFVTKED